MFRKYMKGQKTSLNFKIRTSYPDDESCESIKSFSGSSNSDLTDEEKIIMCGINGFTGLQVRASAGVRQ